jgi:hypothetical protein
MALFCQLKLGMAGGMAQVQNPSSNSITAKINKQTNK